MANENWDEKKEAGFETFKDAMRSLKRITDLNKQVFSRSRRITPSVWRRISSENKRTLITHMANAVKTQKVVGHKHAAMMGGNYDAAARRMIAAFKIIEKEYEAVIAEIDKILASRKRAKSRPASRKPNKPEHTKRTRN